jgi:hypothetical protein
MIKEGDLVPPLLQRRRLTTVRAVAAAVVAKTRTTHAHVSSREVDWRERRGRGISKIGGTVVWDCRRGEEGGGGGGGRGGGGGGVNTEGGTAVWDGSVGWQDGLFDGKKGREE